MSGSGAAAAALRATAAATGCRLDSARRPTSLDDVLGNLGEVGDIELRQGQGSASCRRSRWSISGDALDRVACIEQHAGAKQRASR